jgi:hypothetical protein
MAIIKHHPVVSSNVQSAGYDDDSKTLEVTFKNGAKYSYSGVPRVMYEGIFKSDSPGGFVQRWIVRGKYKNSKQ